MEWKDWTSGEKSVFERLLCNGNRLHDGDKPRVSYVRRSWYSMYGVSNYRKKETHLYD